VGALGVGALGVGALGVGELRLDAADVVSLVGVSRPLANAEVEAFAAKARDLMGLSP
jgi:hypothetical protein